MKTPFFATRFARRRYSYVSSAGIYDPPSSFGSDTCGPLLETFPVLPKVRSVYPGPRSEATSNDVTDTSLFEARSSLSLRPLLTPF